MGRTTTYAYDGDGDLTAVTDPLGRTATFGYDSEGELTSVDVAGGGDDALRL